MTTLNNLWYFVSDVIECPHCGEKNSDYQDEEHEEWQCYKCGKDFISVKDYTINYCIYTPDPKKEDKPANSSEQA